MSWQSMVGQAAQKSQENMKRDSGIIFNSLMNAHNEAKLSTAKNKAISKYNEKLQYETMQAVNQANLERGAAISQYQNAKFNVGVMSQQEKSEIALQAGATDTIGASVSDAVAMVNTNESLDKGDLSRNFEDTMLAQNIQTETMLRQAKYNMKSAYSDQSGKALGQGLMTLVGSYAADAAADAIGDGLQSAYKKYTNVDTNTSTDMFGSTAANGGRGMSTTPRTRLRKFI